MILLLSLVVNVGVALGLWFFSLYNGASFPWSIGIVFGYIIVSMPMIISFMEGITNGH
jgi:hypothetical protein